MKIKIKSLASLLTILFATLSPAAAGAHYHRSHYRYKPRRTYHYRSFYRPFNLFNYYRVPYYRGYRYH